MATDLRARAMPERLPTTHGQPTTAFLRLDRIRKEFGRFVALSNVSLTIHEGEFILFLGPSGCGKTTLLRIIAGLETQTSGRLERQGKDISDLPPARRDYGIVFQSYALFPNLTVHDNIAFGLRSQRLPGPDIKHRVQELLELIGLSEAGPKYPSQLSGGQQQRVAVARAAATSPSLLLLDEPLSALDAQVRVHLRAELKNLHRRLGITTIMVTHDQGEALALADRIVVMNHGVIEQVGTPLEIYQQPLSPFVAEFIGTMNFIPGIVAAADLVAAYGGAVTWPCDTTGFTVGQEVRLAVRAEDIRFDNAHAQAVRFRSRVNSIEFNGAFCRVVLRPETADAGPLTADIPTFLLHERPVSVGGVVDAALLPSQIRAFRAC